MMDKKTVRLGLFNVTEYLINLPPEYGEVQRRSIERSG